MPIFTGLSLGNFSIAFVSVKTENTLSIYFDFLNQKWKDDEEGELFLRNGGPTKDGRYHSQPIPLSELLTMTHLWHPAIRIRTFAGPACSIFSLGDNYLEQTGYTIQFFNFRCKTVYVNVNNMQSPYFYPFHATVLFLDP